MTWTDAKNDRRCKLIDQPRRSPNEETELEYLQWQMRVHRHAVAPLPIAEARAALQQAKARVGGVKIGEVMYEKGKVE